MVEERTHTQSELIRQKELDLSFINKWGKLGDDTKKRFKHLFKEVDKRIKDNYKGFMEIKFFNLGGLAI